MLNWIPHFPWAFFEKQGRESIFVYNFKLKKNYQHRQSLLISTLLVDVSYLMYVEIKENLNGICFTFGIRNCDISIWQWLKSVASKNKSSKINFANHEAFLPHTPKNSKFVSLELSQSLTFLSRHLSVLLIKA